MVGAQSNNQPATVPISASMLGDENPTVISVHEYELREGVSAADFRSAIEEAAERDCFTFSGLEEYWFGQGIRGTRDGKFVAIWRWDNLDAWKRLWGPINAPKPKKEYPEKWLIWEDEILAPLLASDPDKISFTSYQAVILP